MVGKLGGIEILTLDRRHVVQHHALRDRQVFRFSQLVRLEIQGFGAGNLAGHMKTRTGVGQGAQCKIVRHRVFVQPLLDPHRSIDRALRVADHALGPPQTGQRLDLVFNRQGGGAEDRFRQVDCRRRIAASQRKATQHGLVLRLDRRRCDVGGAHTRHDTQEQHQQNRNATAHSQ
ncbi:hypothetical protein RM530_11070 [Algiphilus sp. W345]|uniref:Uncharacterized protein n=1 Tax=Banduia mediterranea TaxID=3075609 RepID=A0ABU2WJ53_9GAMM|nr:hypothetical protein [Algiphilus sp. W345]MDT0497899.1 hypothetical protein [Algiphilus sp. W345]